MFEILKLPLKNTTKQLYTYNVNKEGFYEKM